MERAVWAADSNSNENALQEADDFMGAAGTVNISKEDATPDITPPDNKKRRIIEAGKQEPVTQEVAGKSAKAPQVESSTAKNIVGQILNPGGGPEVKKKKKKNLIEDGPGQASNLIKESEGPQESQMPCVSGGSSTNTLQTNCKPDIKPLLNQFLKWVKNNKSEYAAQVPKHCKKCNITFRSPERLKEHCQNVHSTEDSFTCPDCNKIFPSPGGVIEHRIVMHNGEKIYKCSQCYIIEKNAMSLNQHHRIYHGFPKCSECSEEFSSLALLKQHQWEAHNIGKVLKCSFCSETFINFTKFMKHRKSHRFECTVCHSIFKKPAQLKKHEETHV